MRKASRKIKNNAGVFAIFLFVFLTLYVISKMSMYVWGLYTSVKTQFELTHSYISFPQGWPWEWAWENYFNAFASLSIPITLPNGDAGVALFDTLLLNTLLYTLVCTLLDLGTSWLVAYLMVRFKKFKLNAIIYTVNIAIMTIPIFGTGGAALQAYQFLGWWNNYSFYFWNSIAFTGMHLLYFHAFIEGLGKEYYEAAYVDGAGNFTIMMRITFPLTQGMFWVFYMTGAIGRWNDWNTPIIWMPDYPTLGYALYYMTSGEGGNETSAAFLPNQIAICMMLMVPLLILFFAFQEQMLSNLRIGGIKG